MELRTLLVDEDDALRGELWGLLSMYGCFTLAGEAGTTEDGKDFVEDNDVDVVFINYQPAEARRTSTGDYLAVLLAQRFPDVQVVLYSDDAGRAYQAYRSQCMGFLLTPFDPLALQSLVNRLTYVRDLQLTKQESLNRSIMIRTRNGYQLARLSDILFIERRGRSNVVVTEGGAEIVLQGYTMNEIEHLLEGSGFYRCYQSFIVNLSKVAFVRADSASKNYAIQFNGYSGEVLLSRSKYSELVGLLKERYARLNL